MIVIGYEPGKVHVVDAYTGMDTILSLAQFYCDPGKRWDVWRLPEERLCQPRRR